MALPGGEWFYCRHCRLGGDVIDLGARRWGVAEEAALDRLGLSLKLTEKEAWLRQSGVRTAFADFWRRSVEYYPQAGSTEIRVLKKQLGLEGLARTNLLGAATTEAVNSFLGSAGAQALPGKQEREWLFFPLSSYPGRPNGLYLLGLPEPRSPEAQRHVRVFQDGDPGLGFIENLYVRLDGSNQVVITTDPGMAISFLARHEAWFSNKIPLLFSASPESLPFWRDLRADPPCIWAPWQDSISPGLASKEDGFTTRFSAKLQKDQLLDKEPAVALRQLLSRAIPWKAEAQYQLQNRATADAALLIDSWNLSRENLSALQEALPRGEKTRLVKAFAGGSTNPASGLIERRDGLYAVADNECVSSALIRVNEVLAAGGQSWFSGTVSFQSKIYPFAATSKDLKNTGLLQWIADFLRDRAQAGLMTFQPRWNARSLMAVMALHPPRYRTGSSRVGWDDAAQALYLPGGTIERGGLVSGPRLCGTNEMTPGRKLELHEDLSIANSKRLSIQESGPFWAVFLAVLARISAPIVRQEAPPLLCPSESAGCIQRIAADFMGCPLLEASSNRKRNLLSQAEAHAWPLAAGGLLPPSLFHRQGSENILATVSRQTANILGWRNRYWSFAPNMPFFSTDGVDPSARGLFGGALRHILTKPVWPHGEFKTVLTDVVREWFGSKHGPLRGVDQGEKYLETPASHSPGFYLARLLAGYVRKKWLTFGTKPDKDIVHGREGVKLAWKKIRKLIHAKSPHAPKDYFTLETTLSQTGLLTTGDNKEWALSKDWLALLRKELAEYVTPRQPRP